MTTPLPTPRQLLTSLLKTLTTTPPAPPSNPTPTNPPYDSPSNPLKSVVPSQRALLTTLHVLFPPPTLLQALDLLDRGLVTRVIQAPSTSEIEGEGERKELESAVQPPQAGVHLSPSLSKGNASGGEKPKEGGVGNQSEDEKERGEENRNFMYLVQSSQVSRGRFGNKDSGAGAMTYIVRLHAWNCTCAAFTFSAFPGTGGTFSVSFEEDGDDDEGGILGDIDRTGDKSGEVEEGWEFGGLSLCGKDGGNVPVCKHLLACLLGEKWDGVLGIYVKERVVGREEMAGLGGE